MYNCCILLTKGSQRGVTYQKFDDVTWKIEFWKNHSTFASEVSFVMCKSPGIVFTEGKLTNGSLEYIDIKSACSQF